MPKMRVLRSLYLNALILWCVEAGTLSLPTEMLSLKEKCGRRSFNPYMKPQSGFVYPYISLHQDTEIRLNFSCVASKIKNKRWRVRTF